MIYTKIIIYHKHTQSTSLSVHSSKYTTVSKRSIINACCFSSVVNNCQQLNLNPSCFHRNTILVNKGLNYNTDKLYLVEFKV